MTHEITSILEEWKNGDRSAIDRLYPLVYEELKRQARGYLSNERSGHTLQPTALVNEAYLRLVGINKLQWEDRAHFFAVSAMTMRRILVDHARKIAADKRGGNLKRLTLGNLQIAEDRKTTDLLELEDALVRFEKMEERKAKVIELRFYGGLNQKEIAEFLGVTEKTVQRDWNFAKLWLYRELTRQ